MLKYQISHSSEKQKNTELLRKLIREMSEESFDFGAAIECCRIIANHPSIIESDEKKKKHYARKGREESTVDPKKVAFAVVKEFLKDAINDPTKLHIAEWAQARE